MRMVRYSDTVCRAMMIIYPIRDSIEYARLQENWRVKG